VFTNSPSGAKVLLEITGNILEITGNILEKTGNIPG
jgi:hypothetical protein